MIRVEILVPVLGRPERPPELVSSLERSYSGRLFDLALVWLCSPEDDAQIEACDEVLRNTDALEVVEWEAGAGDYARKINRGWNNAVGDVMGNHPAFVFLGADDLDFRHGWIQQAVSVQLDTGACVIGVNDLGAGGTRIGTASTHSLVSVDYRCGLIDDPDPGKLLFEGYDHNFVDNEFVGTALHRGVFAHAPHAHVEHLHPIHRKSDVDATYTKGQRRFADDRDLHRDRRVLWARPGTEKDES